METSLKPGFAQIFSCSPKKSELPKIWGGCSPPRPPARTPMPGAEKDVDLVEAVASILSRALGDLNPDPDSDRIVKSKTQ